MPDQNQTPAERALRVFETYTGTPLVKMEAALRAGAPSLPDSGERDAALVEELCEAIRLLGRRDGVGPEGVTTRTGFDPLFLRALLDGEEEGIDAARVAGIALAFMRNLIRALPVSSSDGGEREALRALEGDEGVRLAAGQALLRATAGVDLDWFNVPSRLRTRVLGDAAAVLAAAAESARTLRTFDGVLPASSSPSAGGEGDDARFGGWGSDAQDAVDDVRSEALRAHRALSTGDTDAALAILAEIGPPSSPGEGERDELRKLADLCIADGEAVERGHLQYVGEMEETITSRARVARRALAGEGDTPARSGRYDDLAVSGLLSAVNNVLEWIAHIPPDMDGEQQESLWGLLDRWEAMEGMEHDSHAELIDGRYEDVPAREGGDGDGDR